MTVQCPECGAFCRVVPDPCLPPTLGNARCRSDTCRMDVVAEAVEAPA
jgi:hypothetical protein